MHALGLLRAFFSKPIVARKKATTKSPAGFAAPVVAQAPAEPKKWSAAMRRDLGALFDRHPDSRRIAPNLHRVEQSLQAGGLRMFEALPRVLIARALQELERLVRDWSPVGLGELRSRMAVLLKQPAQAAPDETARERDARAGVGKTRELRPLDPTDLDISRGTDISEVDHEVYEEMERSWRGAPPPESKAG